MTVLPSALSQYADYDKNIHNGINIVANEKVSGNEKTDEFALKCY